MKKLITLLLVGCLCLTMTACGNTDATDTNTVENENTESAEVATEEIPTEEIASEESVSEEISDGETEEAVESDSADSVETEAAQTEASGALVVYFSCTGNTRAIAEAIAEGLSADLHEIVPEVPYTAEDLNYSDNNSRSTLEMNDSSTRPAISGGLEDISEYDTIYIGYPIWWGEAPRILATFVESYDFTDKTVVPFCTSASSGMGSSASGLEALAGGGTWLEGRRFSGSESADTVMEWVNGL